jgi:hypothetical protein
MDELQLLSAVWEQPDPPSAAAFSSARASLLDLASGDPRKAGHRRQAPWPKARVAAGLVAVVAGAAVVAGVVASGGGKHPPSPGPSGSPASLTAAVVLDRAASAAAAQPFTPPRPDQWVYIEYQVSQPLTRGVPARAGQPPAGLVVGPHAPLHTQYQYWWAPADGKLTDFNLEEQQAIGYAGLLQLPKTPARLLAWARRTVPIEYPPPASGSAFDVLDSLLYNDLLPPSVEATIFHALALMPGVTLTRHTTGIQGGLAIGISYIDGGWERVEILLNPSTYGYLGERDVATADYTSGGPHPWTVRKGQVWRLIVRKAAAVVNHDGQLPPGVPAPVVTKTPAVRLPGRR